MPWGDEGKEKGVGKNGGFNRAAGQVLYRPTQKKRESLPSLWPSVRSRFRSQFFALEPSVGTELEYGRLVYIHGPHTGTFHSRQSHSVTNTTLSAFSPSWIVAHHTAMPGPSKSGQALFLGLELSTDQLRATIVDENLELVGVEAVDFDTALSEYQ
ncbi:hypothetical protein BC827DRAFT_195901 [Russula dissimulans]|nr:hypothetical protein BC827DRAFT_195901 [Russula dissimulans]